MPTIVTVHTVPGYRFAGRQLPWNYLESAGFKCARCGKTVYNSKRPIDHGAGKMLKTFSCFCFSISVRPGYTPFPEIWDEMCLEAWNASFVEDDPVDHLEPAVEETNEYRECARKFLRLLEQIDDFMLDSVDPWRGWCALSLALGLRSTQGKTVTEVARSLNISKALLSKNLRKFIVMTGFQPAFGLKTEMACATYAEVQRNRKKGVLKG